MIAAARNMYSELAVYLLAAYLVAAAAMAPFAGSLDEIFAFGALAWTVPALIAFATRDKIRLIVRFGLSAICLAAIIALVWAAGLIFQMTY